MNTQLSNPIILNNGNGHRHVSNRTKELCDLIFFRVCEFYSLSPEECRIKTRRADYVKVRQVSMYFMRTLIRTSLYDAAAYFGQDHATASHAKRTVDDLKATYRSFVCELAIIENEINADLFKAGYVNTTSEKEGTVSMCIKDGAKSILLLNFSKSDIASFVEHNGYSAQMTEKQQVATV